MSDTDSTNELGNLTETGEFHVFREINGVRLKITGYRWGSGKFRIGNFWVHK